MSAGGSNYGVDLIPLDDDFGGLSPQRLPLGRAGAGAPPQQKTAKSLLHEFYQQHGGTPDFDVKSCAEPPAEPCFRCRLECPAVDTNTFNVPMQTFSAEARSKKAAEQTAAQKAVDSFRAMGVMAIESELYVRQEQQGMLRVNAMPGYQNFCGGAYAGQTYAMHSAPAAGGGGGGVEEIAPEDLSNITFRELQERYRKVVQENSRLRQALGSMLQIGQSTLEAS